ncbi:MAG: hypothetical protein WDA22_17625 [Bacteroidota bacterium]
MKQMMIIFAISLILISCKNEDLITNQTTLNETVTDYYPMSIGSYWVYKVYEADTSLVFSDAGLLDSIVVTKDSLVNGYSYKVFKSSIFGVSLYRDSSEMIVNNDGEKLLSLNKKLTFIENRYVLPNDTMYYLTSVLSKTDSTFSVLAGTFNSKYIIGTIKYMEENPPYMKQRNYKTAYAKNVGLVYKRLFYLFGPNYLEYKLLRYQIK